MGGGRAGGAAAAARKQAVAVHSSASDRLVNESHKHLLNLLTPSYVFIKATFYLNTCQYVQFLIVKVTSVQMNARESCNKKRVRVDSPLLSSRKKWFPPKLTPEQRAPRARYSN